MQGRPLVWSMSIAILVAVLARPVDAATPHGLILVTGEATYENGAFAFTENIVVLKDATLTFRNATVFLDAPVLCPTRGSAGYCQPSILLQGGTLRIVDSVVSSYTYEEHDPDSGWSVAGVAGVLDLRGSTLTRYKSLGLQSPGPERSLVRDNVFLDARGGLNFIRGAVADVSNNSFERVYAGVSFHDSESTLVGNAFRDVGRDYGAGLFGRAIDVQSTLVGEKLYRALTRVESNVVENATQAMLNLNGFPNEIRGNVFRGNGQGLVVGLPWGDGILHSDAPLIEGNVFESNRDALAYYTSGVQRLEGEPPTLLSRVHGNSFVGTACREIAAGDVSPRVRLTVDARGNWWGSADGPQDHGEGCPALTGNVLVDPWLTEAP